VSLGQPFLYAKSRECSVATCEKEVSADGFQIIRLQNPLMSVSVLPQLGGKIHQMVDRRTGRNWLWKNPHIALRQPVPGMDYDRELDSGGWDEVLFSVKPCSLDLPGGQHLSIGDHGVLVDKAWHITEAATNGADEAVCELHARGRSPSFSWRRRMVLDADLPKLNLEYQLTNSGDEPWPWMWCAHPLIAIEDNMQIGLQQGQSMRLWQGPDEHLTKIGTEQLWPVMATATGMPVDLTQIFDNSVEPASFHAKIFVRSKNGVRPGTRDGTENFRIDYDPDSLPWLGLWVNKRSWSGCGSEPYLNLGVEPATAPHETLSEAVDQGTALVLQPGESHTWSLSVSLAAETSRHG